MNESIKFYGNMIDCSRHGIQKSDEHGKCPKCEKVSACGITDQMLGKTGKEPKNISDIINNLTEQFPFICDCGEIGCSMSTTSFKLAVRSEVTSLLGGMPLEKEERLPGVFRGMETSYELGLRDGKNEKSKELNQWREGALK